MFGLFKRDPKKALQKEYMALMKEARDLQRSGKIPELARKTAEANAVLAKIEAMEAAEGPS
jgi:ribosome-binding protein aMBF1 (putative translation factor)